MMFRSEGGVITMTYLSRFGYAALDHMIAIASAHNGMSLAGECRRSSPAVSSSKWIDTRDFAV